MDKYIQGVMPAYIWQMEVARENVDIQARIRTSKYLLGITDMEERPKIRG